MQHRDKKGVNNPYFGKIKSLETIAKLTKLVYVYNSLDLSYIGEFSTTNCSKHYNMGKDTLTKYIKNGLPFSPAPCPVRDGIGGKGKIFSLKKLH